MASCNFKVESGIQMFLRLTKKTDLSNFYPNLFKTGPKQGHVIELFSEDDTTYLLYDIICESFIRSELSGNESGVIILNTDGKFNLDIMVKTIEKKLANRVCDVSLLDNFLQNILANLFVFEIYDATQLYTTIQNLDGVLMNHPNISLIIFDTLTAFYWSEQNFKITKMDVYLKHLLKIIQRAVKDYKVVTLYTRPQYFSSSKESIENMEACCEHPSFEQINYRIQVVFTDDDNHYAIVRTYNDCYRASFRIHNNSIVWA